MAGKIAPGVIAIWIVLAMSVSGCDVFKSWFDTTAKTTVIKPQEKANTTKLQIDLKTINSSIEIFHARHGRYPDSLDELARLGVLHKIPPEPFGGVWIYDRYNGTVKSSTYPDMSSD